MPSDSDLPIDAVITWVDGQDPAHHAKLQSYIESIGGVRPRTAGATRFYNSGEIDYCITSLLKFAPWLRNIYIVTDEQTPEIVHKLRDTEFGHRIKVVDHRDIFFGYESVLPTFNIRSILTVLWRVPGLSENFIFLNDDFALLRPVQPTDFFRNGKVVVRGTWHTMSKASLLEKIRHKWLQWFSPHSIEIGNVKARHLHAQELSAEIAGFNHKYYRLEHNPHPWRVSTMKKFFTDFPDFLTKNIQYKVRSVNQFISECLAAHLEIAADNAIFDNRLKTLQLKPADQSILRVQRKMTQADRNNTVAFVCIQSVEKADQAKQELVFAWLDKRIGKIDSILTIKN